MIRHTVWYLFSAFSHPELEGFSGVQICINHKYGCASACAKERPKYYNEVLMTLQKRAAHTTRPPDLLASKGRGSLPPSPFLGGRQSVLL